MNCPYCPSNQIVKNGHTPYGKQRYQCKTCGRQLVDSPTCQTISQQTRNLVISCC